MTPDPVGAKYHTPPNLIFVHHMVVSGWSSNRNNHKEKSHTYSSGKQEAHVVLVTNENSAKFRNYGAFALPLHFVHAGDVCTQRVDKYLVLSSCIVHTFIYITVQTYTRSRHSPVDTSRNERKRNQRRMPW